MTLIYIQYDVKKSEMSLFFLLGNIISFVSIGDLHIENEEVKSSSFLLKAGKKTIISLFLSTTKAKKVSTFH